MFKNTEFNSIIVGIVIFLRIKLLPQDFWLHTLEALGFRNPVISLTLFISVSRKNKVD